jgi:hypothetical protein
VLAATVIAMGLMAITVAPTIPVLAAMSAPTRITASDRPPRRPRASAENDVSSDSAMRAFSSTTPMKTNRGTAIRV